MAHPLRLGVERLIEHSHYTTGDRAFDVHRDIRTGLRHRAHGACHLARLPAQSLQIQFAVMKIADCTATERRATPCAGHTCEAGAPSVRPAP